MENIKEIKKFILLFVFRNKNINGIVPMTDDKNIFFIFVILVNKVDTPNNIT